MCRLRDVGVSLIPHRTGSPSECRPFRVGSLIARPSSEFKGWSPCQHPTLPTPGFPGVSWAGPAWPGRSVNPPRPVRGVRAVADVLRPHPRRGVLVSPPVPRRTARPARASRAARAGCGSRCRVSSLCKYASCDCNLRMCVLFSCTLSYTHLRIIYLLGIATGLLLPSRSGKRPLH